VSRWNFMSYDSKDTLLPAVRKEAETFFALASDPASWEGPTAHAWQVRDVVGHMVDVTESYFVGFDAARGSGTAAEALGLIDMARLLNEGAQSHRTTSQTELLDRLHTDFDKAMEIFAGLGQEDWGGLTVPHKYMGPLPAFFYPEFQLLDYTVHSWDIRQGTGRSHAIAGDSADLLVPVNFVLWSSTATTGPETEPMEIGIRVTSGPNAGDTRLTVGPDGVAYEQGSAEGLPTVIEFDPASLLLTTFGRVNSGTVRGDQALADRFLNLFFRI
jgi:uncharacterized protein (TIGR03083 family)